MQSDIHDATDDLLNLDVHAVYSGQSFKHILAPIWLLTYHFGSRSFQAVMNGVTGTIQGEYPKSWVKLTLLGIAILIGLIVVLSLGTHR